MMNPALLLKAKLAKDKFLANHPKVMPFFKTVQETCIAEGTVLAITVKTPDGRTLESNIKLLAEDIALYNDMMAVLDSGTTGNK